MRGRHRHDKGTPLFGQCTITFTHQGACAGGAVLLLWLRGTPQVRWAGSGPGWGCRLGGWKWERTAQPSSAAPLPERSKPFRKSVQSTPAIFSGCYTGVTRGSKESHLWAACDVRRGGKMAASWANRSFSVWQDSYYFIAARQRWWIMKSVRCLMGWHHPSLNISAIHHTSLRRLTFKRWQHQGQGTKILLANIREPPWNVLQSLNRIDFFPRNGRNDSTTAKCATMATNVNVII